MSSSPWFVRPPELADAAPLAAIAAASTAPIDASQINWFMDQNDGRFWTLTQRAQPIGYAALLPLPGLPHLFELTGGITPEFRRQGAGSFLWRTLRAELARTAAAAGSGQSVPQITHTVSGLDTPAACFLQHHHFTLEHEEWTMQLDDLPAASFPPSPIPSNLPGTLKSWGQAVAGRSLPSLYKRCFTGRPWCQPYTAAEIAATWEPGDELVTLKVGPDTVGFAWLHFAEPGTAQLEPVGIVLEKQGMGYGRFLLTAILQQLQNQGIQTVSLGVWANNETAIRLYQSLGFVHQSSSYSLTYTIPPT